MSIRNHTNVGEYYDQEAVEIAEATGAGLIWFMGQDHLSPPLSNEDRFAMDSRNWRQASSNRVLDLATRMGMQEGQIAVDLGCGIGGPGRDIVKATGVTALGLSISFNQLRNLRRLSSETDSTFSHVTKADMQCLPIADSAVDHVYSINAMYHVDSIAAVTQEAYRVLKPGGRFGVDDWFTTADTTPQQTAMLRHNWSTSANGFHNIDGFMDLLSNVGFRSNTVIDYTEDAGAFLSEERFGKTYDSQIAPALLDAFPKLYQYDGYEPEHADLAVGQLRSDILYMGELYRQGTAVYHQVIATK